MAAQSRSYSNYRYYITQYDPRLQEEILNESKGRGWMDVYFEAPKIYNFDINTVGVIANIQPALTTLSDSITNKTKKLFTGI